MADADAAFAEIDFVTSSIGVKADIILFTRSSW